MSRTWHENEFLWVQTCTKKMLTSVVNLVSDYRCCISLRVWFLRAEIRLIGRKVVIIVVIIIHFILLLLRDVVTLRQLFAHVVDV